MEGRAELLTGWLDDISSTHNRRDGGEDGGGNDSSDYESDWETEITANGEVYHVVPLADPIQSNQINPLKREKKKSKKMGKLSRLVRRRETKREKLLQSPQNESSDGDSSTYGQIKTFESFFEGTNPVELLDLPVRLTLRKGERVNLLQDTLGIIAEESERKDGGVSAISSGGVSPFSAGGVSPFSSNRVIISGFLPGAPGLKLMDKLKVGDWIRSIDGQQINLENMDSVLKRYSSSCKVKLTVQRTAEISQLLGEDEQLFTPPSLLKIVTGQGPSPGDVESMLSRLPYIALYLSRQVSNESSAEFTDVIYQFPAHQTSKLIQVRGLFLTLGHALPEITGSRPVTSSLLVEEELVHVGYAEEREDLFLLALPDSKGSAKEVSQIVRDTVRILRLKYKTLSKAFNPKHKGELNELFSQLFLRVQVNMSQPSGLGRPVLDTSAAAARFDEYLPAAQLLHLPDDLKFQVDDALSQLESGDFQEYSPDFFDAPREFNIVGSCLFHKGYLVASHLCRDHMVDILVWGRYNHVLPLTRLHPVQQIVCWSEIHPTAAAASRLTVTPLADTEPRFFLLVAGLGHQLLAVLLETGVGGAVAPGEVVRPDPFYVDQAMNTLEDLVDMGLPLVCNQWLTLPPNPDILNVDKLLESPSGQRLLESGGLGREERPPAPGIVLKKTRNCDYASTDSPSGSLDESLNQSQSDANSEMSEELRERRERKYSGNSSPVSEEESSYWELYHSGQRSHLNFNPSTDEGEEDILHYRIHQLSVSPENTVLHYLHLEVGEGVYLAPANLPSGPFYSAILDNFKAACQIIHSGFQITLRSKDLMKSRDNNPAKPWLNKSLVGVKEQSMLFHLRYGKGEERRFDYWVGGRLFLSPLPRECYVCYQDSAPQMMVELAYRLAFGVHL